MVATMKIAVTRRRIGLRVHGSGPRRLHPLDLFRLKTLLNFDFRLGARIIGGSKKRYKSLPNKELRLGA